MKEIVDPGRYRTAYYGGRVFEVVAHNVAARPGLPIAWDPGWMPPGAAIVSIQAVKGVEIGAGLAEDRRRSRSGVQDTSITTASCAQFTRGFESRGAKASRAASRTPGPLSCAAS